MKILLVIVVLITAFKADCRHFSDEPTNQVSTSNEYPLPDEPVNSDFTVEDQYNKYPESPLVEEVNEQDEITLRGKGGKKLIKKFEFLKYNLTQDNLKMLTELQFLRDNQNNISDTNTKHNMLVLSKMENINNGDKQLKIELQSIKDSNSGLKTDVNTMKNNMNSYNSNIVSKLNSIGSQLDTIRTAQGQGYLKHFPYARYKKTWADAKAYCEAIGGQIWTPVNREDTVNAFKACGTLCWNGWHKNSHGQWVTGTGELKNSNFWAPNEPDNGEDAVWSSSGGLYARAKGNRYGWTCQM